MTEPTMSPYTKTGDGSLTSDQLSKLEAVAFTITQLNEAVRMAVHAGLSIEHRRVARHHDTGGYWGDILRPHVVKIRVKNEE